MNFDGTQSIWNSERDRERGRKRSVEKEWGVEARGRAGQTVCRTVLQGKV